MQLKRGVLLGLVVLLRFGVPTVRFTAQDCMRRPDEVVSEFLSILMNAAPDWAQDVEQ